MAAPHWPWTEALPPGGEAAARRVARALVEAGAEARRRGEARPGAEEAPLWVVGDGAEAVALRAAAAAGREAVVARLAPARQPAEVLLAVGAAVEAAPAGDAAAVGRTLAGSAPLLVVLADADACPAAADAVREELAALAPATAWIQTGRTGPDHALVLPDGTPPLPPPAAVPARAALLAWTGASLPGRLAGVPAGLVLPLPGERLALARPAAAALRARTAPEAGTVARRALAEVPELLALAEDRPLPRLPHPDDAAVLAWLAAHLPAPDEAARAAAAAARLLGRLGQPAAGRALLEDHAGPRVDWARGDLALARGELAAARQAWTAAADALADAPRLAFALHRGCARRLAERGHAEAAARALREARTIARALRDGAARADVLRDTAEVALSRGEILGAGALLDQLPDGTPADRLARAGLALAQGDLPAARRLLAPAEDEDAASPLLAAHLDRRRADLALREGAHAAADRAAATAADRYLRLGEEVAAARTWRLRGDIAAAAGDPDGADRWWQEAAARQVRVRDLVGLERTLSHALLLEAELVEAGGGDPVVLRALRAALAALGEREVTLTREHTPVR